MKRLLLFVSMLLSGLLVHASDSLRIVVNGKSHYRIQLAPTASQRTKDAAAVLQDYINRISGATLELADESYKSFYLIVFEEGYSTDHTFDISKTGDEGFRLHSSGNTLYFSAATAQGIQNAVYSFLEKQLGCHYYASDAQFVPSKRNIILGPVDDFQTPVFDFRAIYYGEAFMKPYIAWHKLDNEPHARGETDFAISSEWGLWGHSMHRLVPPEKYFKKHPEYFALRGKTRVKDQLCLSNPNVLRITVESLKKRMEKKPDAKYWSVSQMDNQHYCRCAKCRAADSIEGSHAGSIIRFVNKVAEFFPDKVISALAYQYSRDAPVLTIPAKNVNIMLCAINADRGKPMASDTADDSFYKDLEHWSALTKNIIVWDYVVNFSHLDAPFPNIEVLKSNLMLFKKFGVPMVFEQGWQGFGGEFEELRCYMLSKLLWNPALDADSLMAAFCNGYYGKAGPYVCRYIRDASERLNGSGRKLGIYDSPVLYKYGYLSPDALNGYFSIFNDAMNTVAGDTIFENRVNEAIQPLRYAWLEVSKSMVNSPEWLFEKRIDGTLFAKKVSEERLAEFYRIAQKYGPERLSEMRTTPEEYYRDMLSYFRNGTITHLALQKTITFNTMYSDDFAANGRGSLTDGVRGTSDYQCLWQGWQGRDVIATIDLDKMNEIRQVGISCLDDNLSGILFPSKFSVSFSKDGRHYRGAKKLRNRDAGAKIDLQSKTFTLNFKRTRKARFVKVEVKNYGKLPGWRGISARAWTFMDEIIVK